MKGILILNKNKKISLNYHTKPAHLYIHFVLEGILRNRPLILSDLSKWRTITQHYNLENIITANCPSLQRVKQLPSPCSSPDECLCRIPSLVAYMLCIQGMFSCQLVGSSTLLVSNQHVVDNTPDRPCQHEFSESYVVHSHNCLHLFIEETTSSSM